MTPSRRGDGDGNFTAASSRSGDGGEDLVYFYHARCLVLSNKDSLEELTLNSV